MNFTQDVTGTGAQLENIFWKLFNIKADEINKKATLLGPDMGLFPRDLVYLLFEVEKSFAIRISEERILGGGLLTYDSLHETIRDCITVEKE
ncbi:peptide maturation system acyl carrier-related protein [Paenibacillus maysiensis]|uniref:peptide maturation system acyl carrier-related protein n=1 Tax=Paenibacillus maysiensis TaxID=1155954 RepID=UPI00046EA9F1|nr:peptide maturation system acyl carrier-related protein [Paenibacillus maysiensis]